LPADREATKELLQAVEYVDLIIPRGSQNVINFVRDNSRVPVIETGAGIVHTYYDASADLQKVTEIIANATTRRVSRCNAFECLVIQHQRLEDPLLLTKQLAETETVIYADEPALLALEGHYPPPLLFAAKEEHVGTEFLSMKLSVNPV